MKRLWLLVLLVSASVGGTMAQLVQLSGRVVDHQQGRGLAYVHVSAVAQDTAGSFPLTVVTDEDGGFIIPLDRQRKYRIQVSHLGYSVFSQLLNYESAMAGPWIIRMVPSMIPLGEVAVSSLRYEKLEKEVALPVTVIPRDYIPRQSALTLSDLLGNEPGLALYRDGMWGTSVSIRGLGENRAVALIDGNRIETATDLAAGLSMIDLQEVERIEVIRGAASSMYGTGAMAGVINVITRKPDYTMDFALHGEATGLFESANRLLGTHVGLQGSAEKFRFRISGGYRDAGDVRTPDGLLENSMFTDRNLNAYVGFKPFKKHEVEFHGQFYQALDVGIPGGAPFGPSAVARYPEERRNLWSFRYTVRDPLPYLEEISLRAYRQFILRDVEILPNTPPVINNLQRITLQRMLPRGEHNTLGAVIESRWKTGSGARIIGGLDLWQRRLVSTREKYIRQEILDDFLMVINTLDLVRGEKPSPDSRFGSAGLFAQYEHEMLNGRLVAGAGMRTDMITVSNDESRDPVFLLVNGVNRDPVPGQRLVFEPDQVSTLSWSANASMLYRLTAQIHLTASAGRSFRSPSLEERFKYIDLGSRVRLGDPELKPEKGWFGDLGFRIWKERLHVQFNLFTHYLHDMIVEVPGVFVYTLTSDGPGVTDTLPALVNANVERAMLNGGEYSVSWQLLPNLVVLSQGSIVTGRNLSKKEFLPLIAPAQASAGLRYQLPGRFSVEWITRAVAPQRRVAQGETETEGYLVTDLSLFSFPVQLGTAGIQFFGGVDNLFNRSYRNHLATNRGEIRVEPGRNLYLKVILRF